MKPWQTMVLLSVALGIATAEVSQLLPALKNVLVITGCIIIVFVASKIMPPTKPA